MAQLVAAPAPTERRSSAANVRVGRDILAWAAGLTIALVAVGARLLHIGMIPRFTDETDEILWSAQIASGEILPLANILTYIGAGFNYVLAGAQLVFGAGDPILARYVVMAMGVLTVGATFLLGRELALGAPGLPREGRRGVAVAAGLVAAAILAVSPVHILVNSRIAYAHSMTPLITTLGLWLLVRAARLRSGPTLAWAGLVLGFALQSHPTVLGLVPGAIIWAAWSLRPLLRSRWLGVAALTGALGCGTLIGHNLLTGFGSVREALSKSAAYTEQRGAEPEPYPLALALELKGFVGTLAGAIGDRRDAEVQLADPSVLAWILLAPVALLVAARLGAWLPLLLTPPFVLILPAFNANFDPLFEGRYFMPLVPPVVAAVAVLLLAAWQGVGRAGLGLAWPLLGRAGLAISATLLLLVSPVQALRVYEQAALAEGGNLPYYELADRIARERRPHEQVLLDSDLGGVRQSSSRDGIGVVEYLLTFRSDPAPVVSARVDEVTALARAHPDGYLLVLLPSARQKLETRFRLTLVGRAPAPSKHRLDDVRLYRVREVR